MPEYKRERRATGRNSVSFVGSMRLPGENAQEINILSLSVEGCSIEPTAFVATGGSVWLRLPGLESWESSVVWAEEGRADVKFKKPLHEAVVANLIERQQARSAARIRATQKANPLLEQVDIRARLGLKRRG